MEGRERVMVMGKGGTAQRYWVLRMETAQNQSSSDNAPKHTSLHEKISVMNSTIMTQLQILVFHSHGATATTCKEFTAVPLVK